MIWLWIDLNLLTTPIHSFWRNRTNFIAVLVVSLIYQLISAIYNSIVFLLGFSHFLMSILGSLHHNLLLLQLFTMRVSLETAILLWQLIWIVASSHHSLIVTSWTLHICYTCWHSIFSMISRWVSLPIMIATRWLIFKPSVWLTNFLHFLF